MKFNKIIYIRYIPLTKKIYEDFYMEEVLSCGLDVEYWDISKLVFKSNQAQEDSSHLVKIIKFNGYVELDKAMQQIDNSQTLFISIMTFEWRIDKLYSLFKKNNCILGVFGRNMFPLPQPSPNKLLEKISRLTLSKLKNIWHYYKFRKNQKKGNLKEYDIIFQGGYLGWQGIGQISHNAVEKAQIVNVNSDDYDTYLKSKDCERIVSGDYILFLDQYLPLHPDTALFGLKTIDSEEYYSNLNAYFDRMEKQYGIPVVIAAHPKALKYKETDYFTGRKLYFGFPSQLTKYANVILTHDSTAIAFAIAFEKPLHLITSRSIENIMPNTHAHIVNIADYIGCNYQYVDDESETVIGSIHIENYYRYKYDYLTSKKTENIQTKDIYMTFLKQ